MIINRLLERPKKTHTRHLPHLQTRKKKEILGDEKCGKNGPEPGKTGIFFDPLKLSQKIAGKKRENALKKSFFWPVVGFFQLFLLTFFFLRPPPSSPQVWLTNLLALSPTMFSFLPPPPLPLPLPQGEGKKGRRNTKCHAAENRGGWYS